MPLFIVNVLGEYLRSRGTALPLDRCYATNSCTNIPAYPAVRTDP